MTEYVNKDYYNHIKGNCSYIDLNAQNIHQVMDRLNAEGIMFSAAYGGYRNTVTVSKADAQRAFAIAAEYKTTPTQQNTQRKQQRIIGNIEYSKIKDRNFINTDPATALQVANLLSGDTSIRFSGRILENSATITVSGRKNAEMVNRMIDNIRNADIISELYKAGYERLADNNGFVNIRSNASGEVVGFRSMDMVREMFRDASNEFFHPPAYRVDSIPESENPYYISEVDSVTTDERNVYVDENIAVPVFDSRENAEHYADENNIELSDFEEITAEPIADVPVEHLDDMADLSPTEQLKKRVNAELEAYISEMKSRPFDEIIEAAYRVTTCKKINDYVSNEKLDLTDEQLSAFLSMDNILDEIYLEWVKNDSAETYDDVLTVMQDRANRIILSQQRENVPVEHLAPEAEKEAPTAKSPVPGAPKDEIAEALNLAENNLTFSVITINNELTFAVGEYIERDDIHGLEEYQDYISKNQLDETRVCVEYCMIGNADAESEMAYTDDIEFINENLKAVMDHPLTTNLEINNYLIATPDEMLESRQQEKELAEAKKYIDEYLYDMFRFDGDNFEDMEHIEAGYTELGENGEYRLQMEIDLVNLKIRYSLENEVVRTDSYNSLAEMNELALSNLDFDEFVAIGNDALDEYEYKLFHLVVPELDIDVDMRDIDSIEIQTTDDKLMFYYSTNNNTIERAWESDDNSNKTVDIDEVKSDIRNSISNGFKVTVFETAEEKNASKNLFNTLDYDVNEKYADFIESMDFTVVKVGDKFALRDVTNFGDIHSDVFDSAEDMTGRLDIYINDYYISDIAERLDGIVSGDLSTIDGIIEAINSAADDEKAKEFFNENISDMQMLDLIANKTDKVDLNIAFANAEIEIPAVPERMTAVDIDTAITMWEQGLTVYHNGKPLPPLAENRENRSSIFENITNDCYAKDEDLRVFRIADDIASEIWDMNRVFSNVPNEVGQPYYLSLEYGGYDEWEYYDSGLNEYQNTISALYAGNFTSVETYLENIRYCDDVSEEMQEQAASLLDAEKVFRQISGVMEKSERETENLSNYFTELHEGKFKVEEFYKTSPSIGELADFIQNLRENEKQGFGLSAYTADSDGISFLTPRDDGSRTATEYTWEQVAKAISKAIDEGRYITPEDIAERDKKAPKYTIYQVKKGDEYRNARFSSWEELQEPFDRNNYDEIYSGKISDITNFPSKNAILESIFTKFNIDRPEDFTGHSLSVSDVVVLDTKEGSSAYFVDSFGMADVTDLFFEMEKQKIDISELSEIEINEEYDRRGDEPDNPIHIKNTITFSDLNQPDAISRFKEFTYDFYEMPDDDEGYTTVTNRDMIEEINDYIDRSRKDSSISISITDSEGKTASLEGMNYLFVYEPPLFLKPITDFTAVSEEEIRAYHASNNANMECSKAIEEAIGRNYGTKSEHSLDTDTAIREVLERFSADRVAFVLAARFNELDWDRRISADNISWAKEYLQNIPEQYYENKSFLPHENGLADLFGKAFRKEYLIDREKTDVLKQPDEVANEEQEEKANLIDEENSENVPVEHLDENPQTISIGDKFKSKTTGEVLEVVSLTGALPWYTDDCTVERQSGNFTITENIRYDQLLDSNLYEYIGKTEPEKEQSAPNSALKNDADITEINNLSQLKKALHTGMQFEITNHTRPECIGERRVITGVNSVGFTSRKLDENSEPSGKDIHMEWNKAKNWSFDGGEFTSKFDSGELLMSFHFVEERTREPNGINEPENKGPVSMRKVGDFYEMYGKNAEIAADVLGLNLTSRNGGAMVGFPDKVKDEYSKKLDEAGYTVLIEQAFEINPPKRENVPVEHLDEKSEYTPKIGDLVDIDGQVYAVADNSGGIISLSDTETLFGDTRVMTLSEFLSSGFEVVEASETEAVSADVPLEHLEKAPEKKNVPLEHHAEIAKENADVPVEHHNSNADNFVITDENFGVKTPKARFAANVAAIRTLNAIEAENRTATPEEQTILSGYTGWGAIPNAFDSGNKEWSREYAELKELLTDEEYIDARRSTMNAHFTSPVIINAIYEGLSNLGFEKGKILEPAMGIGNFFGAMPEAMRGSELHGVELDSLTGRIAKQLYPGADIQIKGFEKTKFANDSFDAIVGNVPFGDYKLSDKDYDKYKFYIHDYFVAKSIDKVRPGGVIAVVTSKGTMDKENPEMRKYIAQRAELLGAIRLPNDAFKKNAGTEVTSDILFFQKRERAIEINPDEIPWIGKSETAEGFLVNSYFVNHPEMVLGTIAEANQKYGPTENTQVLPIEGADLKQQLAEAVKNIQGTYTPRAKTAEKKKEADDIIPAPADSRTFSYYAVNGSVYYRGEGETMTKAKLSGESLKKAAAMIEIRDTVRELLDLQLNNADKSYDPDIADCRAKLYELYDSFTQKYGHFDDKKNARVFKGDDGYNFLTALENKNKDTDEYEKADIFFHDTVKPNTIVTHVETAEEALILSVAEKAKVDFEYMTELCGMSKETLINELEGQIYRLPQEEEKYVTADEYLTGNIRTKLLQLENAPDGMDVSKHREALESAMPKRVEAKDISVKLGAHWVAPEFVTQFINEKFYPSWRSRVEAQYSKVSGKWKIEGASNADKGSYTATHDYGTKRKNAYAILEGILNHEDMTIKDPKLDKNGEPIRDSRDNIVKVTNHEETKAVQLMVKKIESEWQDWIFKDPDRREALVEKYNEVFNSIRHREYDGSHLSFVGMNSAITLKEHQKNAVARALYGGNTLLAHAVGAGKTFEMITIAMEGKRLGLHHKCLFAVPNSLTEQMGRDFKKLYPAANILVATKKDFEPKNRKELFAKIATGEWDAVIVGHSQFDRMGLSAERLEKYMQAEIDSLRDELEEARSTDGAKSFSVKEIEKTISRYEKRIKEEQSKVSKDDYIDFEQMGFDKIFVDECHMYKNLGTATKMSNVAGIGTTGSGKAAELLMKTKYLDELTGGKGLVFASGTPVSNSMTELYTMMRYLQTALLQECGISHFDEWAADFGTVKTDYELKPESDGKYQLKTRFAQFNNLPELMGMFKEAADIRTADTLDLEKPVAHVHEVVAQPSKIQKRLIKSLSKRATKIREGAVDPKEDNMLVIVRR